MAKVKNTMKLVASSLKQINPNYDLHSENIKDIFESSNNVYDLICNGFIFGYMQGMKAVKAELKRGNTV